MQGFRELVQLHLAEQEERAARVRQDKLRARIASLDEKLAEARASLATAAEKLKTVQADRRRIENEVEALETNRTKYRTQLMQAKTNEVYKGLLSEIETAGRMISDKETTILELMEQIEGAEAVHAEAKRILEGLEGENRSEAKGLAEEVDALDGARARSRERANLLRADVPPRLLPDYDRILAARDGRALALVVDASCQECHVALRPQAWVELLSERTMHRCVGCGRIQFRPESAPGAVLTAPSGGASDGTSDGAAGGAPSAADGAAPAESLPADPMGKPAGAGG